VTTISTARTYKKPVRLVDIDEALNARHVDDPERDIH
jgi:hypothetical protein